MLLEQALYETNEFQRLQKITQGCKAVTSQLPFMTNFRDTHILKYCTCCIYVVLYCYPFQQSSIEMILLSLVDRFKTVEFCNVIYTSLMEISQMKDVYEYQIPRSRQQSQQIDYILNRNQIPYNNVIYDNIPVIKQFSLQLLKPMFELAYKLGQPLQSYSTLFICYLRNTKNEDLISGVLDCFATLKSQQIFGSWIMSVEDELQYYLKQKFGLTMNLIEVDSISEDSDISEDGHQQLDIEAWLLAKPQGTGSNKSILADIPNVEPHIDDFKDEAFFSRFLCYIIDPSDIPLSNQWKLNYPNIVVTHCPSDYKQENQKLNAYDILRSSKVLQVLIDENNFNCLLRNIPTLYSRLFNMLYIIYTDIESIAYLPHSTILLDFLLTQQPKTSVYQIVDLNLLFSMARYLFNDSIQKVIQQLLCSIEDRYRIGIQCNEHLWKYLNQTKWVQHVVYIMQNKQVSEDVTNKYYKPNQIGSILESLQKLMNFDKLPLHQEAIQQTIKLNELEGTSQKLVDIVISGEFVEYISKDELQNYDIDGLSNILHIRGKEPGSPKMIMKQITNMDADHIKTSTAMFRKRNTLVSIPQQMQLQLQNSISPLQIKNKFIDLGQTPKYLQKIMPSTSQHEHQGNRNNRIKTEVLISVVSIENTTRSGYSIDKVKMLYPSYKTLICGTEFERFSTKYHPFQSHSSGCAQLILSVLSSFVHHNNRAYKIKKLKQLTMKTHDAMSSFINPLVFQGLLKAYLYQILNKQFTDVAQEYGQIVNIILDNTNRVPEFIQSKQSLRECCYECMDFLGKTIIQSYQQMHKISQFKQIQYSHVGLLLINTVHGILKLHEGAENQNIQNRNIYLVLNETVLHAIVLQFFELVDNNLYHQKFIGVLTLIFAKAPITVLITILFKLNLVASTYNTLSQFIQNEVKNTYQLDSFYFHLTLIPYIIQLTFTHRNCKALETQLSMLASWIAIQNMQPKRLSRIHNEIQSKFPLLEVSSPQNQTQVDPDLKKVALKKAVRLTKLLGGPFKAIQQRK